MRFLGALTRFILLCAGLYLLYIWFSGTGAVEQEILDKAVVSGLVIGGVLGMIVCNTKSFTLIIFLVLTPFFSFVYSLYNFDESMMVLTSSMIVGIVAVFTTIVNIR